MSKDDINNPDHYNMNGMETIDLLQESMGMTEFEGYLKGNILKYVSRYRFKHAEDPVKDLYKAGHLKLNESTYDDYCGGRYGRLSYAYR